MLKWNMAASLYLNWILFSKDKVLKTIDIILMEQRFENSIQNK